MLTPEQYANAAASAKKVLRFIDEEDLAADEEEAMHIMVALVAGYVVTDADDLLPVKRRLRHVFVTVSNCVAEIISKRVIAGKFSMRDAKEPPNGA